MKIESINAVLNVASLAVAEVDYLDFGGEDLGFDPEPRSHAYLKTIDACKAHVRQELAGTPIRILG